MAILNYSNQFKFGGEGYLDTKMMPVETVDGLERDENVLSSLYLPGMKVTVLHDDLFGTCDYFLDENYEWKRILALDEITLSLDKGDFEGNDGKEEMYLQLNYKGELLSDPVNLSVLLEDVEKRLDDIENKEDVPVEDTNTFVEQAEIVTEKEGENGLFIKFTYNNGESFYSDITELEPKTYSQGVGILIGSDNVISIDEDWFDTWFDEKVTDIKTKLSDLEKEISDVDGKVTTLSDSLNAISGKVTDNENAIKELSGNLTDALTQISENKIQIENVKTTANEASAKANENEAKISTLSEQLSKIRGVEYIKAGENVSVTEGEDGYITISAQSSTVDTTDIENRLDAVETTVGGHTADIASLQEVKDVPRGGEGLCGGSVTIKTNEQGALSVMISSDENNMLQSKTNGLFVQAIEIILGDEEINAEE